MITGLGGSAGIADEQIAAGTLPDVVRVSGLQVQQWLRQGAFLDLTDKLSDAEIDDFYPGPLEQFRWKGKLWGVLSQVFIWDAFGV